MSNVDVTRDAPRLDNNAIDPNVRVPGHVARDAAAAEALHKATYAPPEPTDAEKAAAAAEAEAKTAADALAAAAEAERAAKVAAQQGQDPPTQVTQAADGDIDKTAALGTPDAERGRYLSMKGRHDALKRENDGLQRQMREMAVELTRTQQLLNQPQLQAQPTRPAAPVHKKLITDEDVSNYGTELIDVARRAALEATAPEIEALRAENLRLNQAVTSSGKRGMFADMDRAVPNWRQINKSPQFAGWLALPNIYTGRPRKATLDEAVAGARAPIVIALMQDFLREAGVTSQAAPVHPVEQPLVPRTAAVPLESLAAPGRAKPAPGDTQVPADKPTYTRAQISANYETHRKGQWNHMLDKWNLLEADMIAAGREGRVR